MGVIETKLSEKIKKAEKRIILYGEMFQLTQVYYGHDDEILAFDDLLNFKNQEMLIITYSEYISSDLEILKDSIIINSEALEKPVIDIDKLLEKNPNIKALHSSMEFFDLIGVSEKELEKIQQELLEFLKTLSNKNE